MPLTLWAASTDDLVLGLDLACVDALVPVGGAPLVERFCAVVATERLLARVDPLVVHQVAPPAERLRGGRNAGQWHRPTGLEKGGSASGINRRRRRP